MSQSEIFCHCNYFSFVAFVCTENPAVPPQSDDAITQAQLQQQQRIRMQMQQQHQQEGVGRTSLNGPVPSQLTVPTNNNIQFNQPLPVGNRPHQVSSNNPPGAPPILKDPKSFGMLGLLDVVKTQDKDLNMLALGASSELIHILH